MRIADIQISRHRLPLDPPFLAAWDPKPRTAFEATIVRVVTDTGQVGIGSGDTMAGFDSYRDLFIGRDPLELERHFQVLTNLQFHDNRFWPLDIALWDLYGKSLGLPVYQLLGGSSDRVPVYASLGSLRAAADMAEQVAALQREGFKAVKIRFHHDDWRDDVRVIEQVRRTAGDAMAIMVDCNQGWRMPWDTTPPWTFDIANAVADALAELNIFWLEEPLHRGDYEGMSRLRRGGTVALAAGEMTREMHELHSLIDRNCIDILQADAVLTQGISGLSNLMPKLRRAGVIFSPHTWSNGIGFIANAQLAAGVGAPPFLEFPYDPPTWSTNRRDFMLQVPVNPDQDGTVRLPSGPGLGIELDEDKLRATQI